MAAYPVLSDAVHVVLVVPGPGAHVHCSTVQSRAQVWGVRAGTQEGRIRTPPGRLLSHWLEDVVPECSGHQSVQLLTGVETVWSKVGVVNARCGGGGGLGVEEVEVGEGRLNHNSEVISLIPANNTINFMGTCLQKNVF